MTSLDKPRRRDRRRSTEPARGSERKTRASAEPPSGPAAGVRLIYEQHAEFVWLSLQRLGVQRPDLEDVAHDVFVIVHRRAGSFDASSKITTWLFGICLRVAANYRRRRRFRLEVLAGTPGVGEAASGTAADDLLVRRHDRELAERVLDQLSLVRRATFVMFEVEGLSCREIADLTNVPVGTVYSRLYSARRQIGRILKKMDRET